MCNPYMGCWNLFFLGAWNEFVTNRSTSSTIELSFGIFKNSKQIPQIKSTGGEHTQRPVVENQPAHRVYSAQSSETK